MPASTGSDWFLCSTNRVYTKTQPEFEYAKWTQALRDGKTFITNGPIPGIDVNGSSVGDTVQTSLGDGVTVGVDWTSYYPVHRVEVVAIGKPVHKTDFPDGSTVSSFECKVDVASDGWIAARIGSNSRDSIAQPIWAHTSPVYIVGGGAASPERSGSAARIVNQIDNSIS